jgi:cation diffusion facilitator CzcD-associated flavoprotein CzcO
MSTVGNTATKVTTDFDAIVIGAGFSGLAMLHHLNELNLSTQVIEAGSGVGGTWYWNRYPGARTDSEFYYYSFSFSKEVREEWVWQERYSAQPEVLAYLEFVARKLDLTKDIRFNTKVVSATFDESNEIWKVRLNNGEALTAKYLVSGMGVLSAPILPDFPGIDTFKGETYQTARWPKEKVELKGKRVGLIGLGASGVQIVPVIAPEVKELFVFQRTPNYVVASTNLQVDDAWMARVRKNYDQLHRDAEDHGFAVPFYKPTVGAKDVSPEKRNEVFEKGWKEGGFHFMLECFNDLATNEESNLHASDFIRKKIRETVKDPVKADLLSPKDYPFNGKRPPGGHGYYEAYNNENVHLIDTKSTPITRVTERGIQVGDKEYELDVIIYATGFDAMTGNLTRIDIVGRGGEVLRDHWKKGLSTNLGLSVVGFPNFFMILGPQTPYANLPIAIQKGVSWIQHAISYAESNKIAIFESTADADESWANEVARAGSVTIMSKGELGNAWFIGANIVGKPKEFNVYMGGADVYFKKCDEAEATGYPGWKLTPLEA